MPEDELIDQLASLSLCAGRGVQKKTSEKRYKDRGDHVVKQLEAHLARVRLGITQAVSPATLGDSAKQEGKGLLKIAQAGLKNTAGGLEPLRLAYEASRALLPLSPFIAAANLTMEKLWYKVASRSIELGDFPLGLRASAYLQVCLDRRKGDDLEDGVDGVQGGVDRAEGWAGCSLTLPSQGNEEDLKLCSFPRPGVGSSVALAKLVSGASLNACRCCLEVGSKEGLRLMTGELGRGAGRWIDRVSELGDDATADSYRSLLFKQLWLGCVALEKPCLGATSRECVVGRQTALRILLRKSASSWNTDVFVAHALRAAVALQERGAGAGDATGARDAAELSVFCLEGISGREGEGWPAVTDEGGGGCGEAGGLRSGWVDWLQFSAGLHQRVGQAAEAQRLLGLAYEYVQRCRKRRQQPEAGMGGDHGAAECAAYASVLKLHMAAMMTSLHPADGDAAVAAAAATAAQLACKQAAKKSARKKSAEPPMPSSAVLALTSRGLDHLGLVVTALKALAEGVGHTSAGTEAEAAAFAGAAVKAWTRAKKSCGVVDLWAEAGRAAGEADGPGEHRESAWSALSVRGHLVLAELSLELALVRRKGELGSVLEKKIPSAASLFQLTVDNYIRVAHAHLSALARTGESGPAPGADNKQTKAPGGSVAKEDAQQALAAAEEVLQTAGDVLPFHVSKRVGTGWFGLGMSLLDRREADAGLNALVRGCRLLERWTEEEFDRQGTGARENSIDAPSVGVSEVLRSVQLDVRLAKLSRALYDSAAYGMAAAAAVRALTFCPGMRCFSSEGKPEPPANAQVFIERFVAGKLQCGGPADSRLDWGTGALSSATVEVLSAYLLDSGGVSTAVGDDCLAADDLPAVLESRGLCTAAIVWALLTACRVYRAHLPQCLSEESGPAVAGRDEGKSGTLRACVEGHRLATDGILRVCDRCRRDDRGEGEEEEDVADGKSQADMWEAHARLLAAKFEHDLHLADVSGIQSEGDATGVCADLSSGIEHAASGAATASRLGGEDPDFSADSVAAAAEGVFACIRAVLLRAVAENDVDVKFAMRQGLDLLDKAARNLNWAPEYNSSASLGPADAGSVIDSLNLLEAHYTLHTDTSRRAKVGEVRLVLADRASSDAKAVSLPEGAAGQAAALGCIGAALQAVGISGLGSVYGALASEELHGLAETERQGAGSGAIEGTSGSSGRAFDAQVEAVRVAVDVLRGMCLAERSGGEGEGESLLLEARRAVSRPGSRAVAPGTAAYLECLAGLGLSWVYQRSGRLVEAMDEVRQVMRLCRAWASAGGPLAVTDKQIVALSAAKGHCIHDEGSGRLAATAATAEVQAEEGIGAEGKGVEDSIVGEEVAAADSGHDGAVVALGSRWIPVYLEGLARMGQLWRERGVASKASVTLRQGCAMSESLHAARFLRHFLVEEVGVAAGKHHFARAERLLRASQDLLRQERQELTSTVGSAFVSDCEACKVGDPTFAAAALDVAAVPIKRGKGPKGGAKKPRGKKKGPAAATTEVTEPARSLCVRCRELAVNNAELAVVEASLLRKQGGFARALAACERGQAALVPVIEASGEPMPCSGSLSFARVTAVHGQTTRGAGEAEANGLGWRVVEVLAMLRLEQGRACCLLGETDAGEELLRDCSIADGAPALVRATALYRIGRIRLDAGDAAGARLPLEIAAALTRLAGVPKLVRKVRRVLAAVLVELASPGGSGGVGVDGSWRVAALSSLSIGVTPCNHFTHASASRGRRLSDDARDLPGVPAGMQLFDVVSGSCRASVNGCAQPEGPVDVCGEGCLKDAVTSDLRAEWPVVSLCLAPGEGECRRLLLTRLVRGQPPLTVSVPLLPDDTWLLERWRGIMEENRDSLRGHSPEEAAKYGNQQKARWWERRLAVDDLVRELLRELEERWFEAHGLAAVLLGDVKGEELGLELQGVFEFAEERIRAASGGPVVGFGVKAASRGKGEMRAREATTAACDEGGAEAESGQQPSGLWELIRVCVRGGEAMSEKAWLAVVLLALSGAERDSSTAAEISCEIHEKVQAAFAREEAKHGRKGRIQPSTPTACAAVGGHPSSSRDIEKCRSSSSAQSGGSAVQITAPPGAVATGGKPSIDEGTMSTLKVTDLRRELTARGIPITGLKVKSDLLSKLVEVVRREADEGAGIGGAGDGRTATPANGTKGRVGASVASRQSSPDGVSRAAATKASGRGKRSVDTTRRSATDKSGSLDSAGSGGGVESEGKGCVGAERHPVVLVLDEELQAIPWEGLPCLRGHAITRVPAVPFVFAALAARWDGGAQGESSPSDQSSGSRGRGKRKGTPSPVRNLKLSWVPSQDGVRLDRGYYVLDPEANLPHTQKHVGPVFRGLERRLGWSGVQGRAPAEDAMAQALEEVDVFAYCGHGAGELLVGREAVARLTKCAVAVLMGCSSGRLKGYGDFEPMGMATSYLAGGSPAVVANLWDVTDKDIDRFSIALLETFLGEREAGEGGQRRAPTLAHAVAESRTACKMPFIIGYAPVCYGIPVAVAASSPAR